MNSLIQQYFHVGEGAFQEVLFLSEKQNLNWNEICEKSPDLPRGWFELSQISPYDRIEFTRDFWLKMLPFNPKTHAAFNEFFEQLDDVAVVLARQEEEGFLVPELAYSLEDNSCFFRGRPPCSEVELGELKNEIGLSLPRDYLSFAKIHNGFGKLSEMGLLEVESIGDARRHVMEMIIRASQPVKLGEKAVDAGALIPFFESIGLSSYQCFYTDWYPGSEMGNVYFSGIDYTISDTSDQKAGAETLAFPTFLDWLAYYLEGMNFSP